MENLNYDKFRELYEEGAYETKKNPRTTFEREVKKEENADKTVSEIKAYVAEVNSKPRFTEPKRSYHDDFKAAVLAENSFYAWLNEETLEPIFNAAYSEGHSGGTSEIINYVTDYISIVDDVVSKLNK